MSEGAPQRSGRRFSPNRLSARAKWRFTRRWLLAVVPPVCRASSRPLSGADASEGRQPRGVACDRRWESTISRIAQVWRRHRGDDMTTRASNVDGIRIGAFDGVSTRRPNRVHRRIESCFIFRDGRSPHHAITARLYLIPQILKPRMLDEYSSTCLRCGEYGSRPCRMSLGG